MNLVEELIKADAKKATELQTGTFQSKNLARILGKKKPVEITIREIPTRRLNDIMAMQFDRKGNFDITKAFDSKALCVSEGVIDPQLSEVGLMEHFGCKTPKDLAIRLFKSELSNISDEIAVLSGISDDIEDEVKN
ncbi:hypothetical protein lbkm_3836 [Lachnospiraceae bacterium KM106-2]|nr:hypothetical protein lbkm_3836 [Lachnospiraceae bacterium KM106-2]